MQKSADAFRTISEVADDLSLPQHVLRFWETRFPQIRPLKRAGGRRYYRPADITLLKTIRQLLYDDGYTIKGVQRLLKDLGAKGLSSNSPRTDFGWTEPDDGSEEVGSPEPSSERAEPVDLADPDVLQAAASAGFGVRHDLLEDALGTIDECQRILASALRSR